MSNLANGAVIERIYGYYYQQNMHSLYVLADDNASKSNNDSLPWGNRDTTDHDLTSTFKPLRTEIGALPKQNDKNNTATVYTVENDAGCMIEDFAV